MYESDGLVKKIYVGGRTGDVLSFGFHDTSEDNPVITELDYKKWSKLKMKDDSEELFKKLIIRAILKKQPQFNRKVEYNMWKNKTNATFEEQMDWFIKNGWISNISKRGIRVEF